jgi:predicted O-methyltransferase YrrM
MVMKYINNLPNHKYPWLPVLYSIVSTFKPKTIIEFGTEHGGTAITIGLALKELYETENHIGKVFTYDTFDFQSKGEIGSNPNYQFALENINGYNPSVKDFIEVNQGDFFEFNKDPNKQYDLLYFDIDNDGDKLLEMYENNISNIEQGSIVIFEGGSEVRDNVPWMIEKNKTKMNSVNVPYKLLTPNQKYSCSIIFNPNLYKIEI